MSTLRANIALWLEQVAFKGVSANQIITQINQSEFDPRDKGLAKACLFGSCRHFEKLSEFLSLLLLKPLKNKESDIKSLLITGLFQVFYTDIPHHAIISESVNATRTLKKDWSSKLVNAVLRNALRRSDEWQSRSWSDPAYREMPDWLLKRLIKAWPNHWASICRESNQQAPMTLRVNQKHSQYKNALNLLTEQQIKFKQLPNQNSALILTEATNVSALPCFDDGLFSVQDASAQLAADLLPLPNENSEPVRVLDACAAPGGKTAHLLEKHHNRNIDLIALELDPNRAEKIQQNFDRLGLKAQLVVGDATIWQSNHLFDAILIDAPCSATGVIRRQPDIKMHRRDADIAELVELQKQILNNLWPQLKVGGYLLYATCSVLPDENHQQIEDFINAHLDAKPVRLLEHFAELGVLSDLGLQIFPQFSYDGFFYALFQKQTVRSA